MFQLCKQSICRTHQCKKDCSDALAELEMCRCSEIIYTRAHRVKSSLNLAARRDSISHGEHLRLTGCSAGVAAHSGPPVEYFPAEKQKC